MTRLLPLLLFLPGAVFAADGGARLDLTRHWGTAVAWVYQASGSPGELEQAVRHSLLEYAELMLFLLLAMRLMRGLVSEFNVYLLGPATGVHRRRPDRRGQICRGEPSERSID